MKNIWVIGFFILFLFGACSSSKVLPPQRTNFLVEQSGLLVHIVFLKTKANLTKEERQDLLKAIKTVEQIEVVQEFSMGTVANTKDNRFISDHDIVFQITVKDLEAYQQYQEHPIHTKLKVTTQNKLAAPPAVYDYWLK